MPEPRALPPAPKPPPRSAAVPATARLFVALWPDARVRAALQRWSERWTWSPDGPAAVPPPARVPTRDLHLTLHFLGAVPRARVPELRAALALPCTHFTLSLGRAERWPRGTAVLCADEVPPALAALHADLGARLRALGLRTEARPLRPHVTLARRAAHAEPPAAPLRLRWPVHGYVLVESRAGAAGAYRVLQRYPAAPAAGA